MGSGCMCAANAVIRALLRHLVVERSEIVILDMEAGVEHVGRATAEHVDVMLIVSDANIKSLEIAKHIYGLAKNADMKQIFLVGNKIGNKVQEETVREFAEENGLAMLGFIPFDQKVVDAEMKGTTPLRHRESEALSAIGRLGEQLITKNA
jgi:CO dehydrogenase maturation factor